MSKEHTTTPWHSGAWPAWPDDDLPTEHWIRGEDGSQVAVMFMGDARAAANARRIVAAVNATKDIPTEALEQGVVPEMVEALEVINRNTHDVLARNVSEAALAKARGGKE